MKYRFYIDKKIIEIESRVHELDEQIMVLVSTFDKCQDNLSVSDAQLIIDIDKIIIIHNTDNYVLNLHTQTRDLYQLFYFFIYMISNNENQSFIHSAIISKNNVGILILGDFGAGKTTLCLAARKRGFEINSADHALIKIIDNKLYIQNSTKRMRYDKKTEFLDNVAASRQVEIKEIVHITGLSEHGTVKFSRLFDPIRIVKKVWKSINWIYTNPLVENSNELLKFVTFNQKNFIDSLSKLPIPFYLVLGDVNNVAKTIEKQLSKIPMFSISAINDEIGDDIDSQVLAIKKANLSYIELRKVNGCDLHMVNQNDLQKIKQLLENKSICVSCISSPIGKIKEVSDITHLEKYLNICNYFKCKNLRVFADISDERATSIDQLKKYCDLAKEKNVKIVLENETKTFFNRIDQDYINFDLLLDNENYSRDKVNYLQAYSFYKKNIKYIHLRDYKKSTKNYVIYGKGDEQVKHFVGKLIKDKYPGFLSLESHLPMTSSNSKTEMFLDAVSSLKKIIGDYYE